MSLLKSYVNTYNEYIEFIEETFRWIQLDGNKSKYMISNLGKLVSFHNPDKPRTLKPNISENGYCMVCLYDGGKEYWRYIHRLVAEYFIPIPKKYIDDGYTIESLEVNHIDGTSKGKMINTVNNLEWNTSSDNKFHAYKTGLKQFGENCPVSKYSNEQIEQVCKLLEEDDIGMRAIWKETGVSVSTIAAILSGIQWKHISDKYDFSNHTKRREEYSQDEKDKAIELLRTTKLSNKEIGDIVGMTRNAVWFLKKKYQL